MVVAGRPAAVAGIEPRDAPQSDTIDSTMMSHLKNHVVAMLDSSMLALLLADMWFQHGFLSFRPYFQLCFHHPTR